MEHTIKVKLSDIVVDENKAKRITESNINELAQSIDCVGLQSPVFLSIVSDNEYYLEAGLARYLACKQLNLECIDSIVLEHSDGNLDSITYLENSIRNEPSIEDYLAFLNGVLSVDSEDIDFRTIESIFRQAKLQASTGTQKEMIKVLRRKYTPLKRRLNRIRSKAQLYFVKVVYQGQAGPVFQIAFRHNRKWYRDANPPTKLETHGQGEIVAAWPFSKDDVIEKSDFSKID